ncbi:hypothetical protein GQ55_1G302700 [Panicum hallii var. hallii]|uniref:Uncharacterized protein n=1 Tax=Panicum hallii var. hallii TaxID=1504633 RepID=A0A2T7F931_9POAL|nr:hypothetical protein GQ55_1G302700 [Panicum hallii var. hallii]
MNPLRWPAASARREATSSGEIDGSIQEEADAGVGGAAARLGAAAGLGAVAWQGAAAGRGGAGRGCRAWRAGLARHGGGAGRDGVAC